MRFWKHMAQELVAYCETHAPMTYISTCSLNISSQNLAVMIPRIFNSLPVEIKFI